jgi:dGTPase
LPRNSLYSINDRSRKTSEPQNQNEYRTCWRKDYGRLIHSPSFRRLQGKTQLYPGLESDFFRNRLTHSLEVAQIAKSIGSKLNSSDAYLRVNNIDLDLLEVAGLAHDIGHPPFGHNGEKALDNCMKNYGGFEGNAQTLRILSRIEKKIKDSESICGITTRGEDRRSGLNLTYRTLASVLKYDYMIPVKRSGVSKIDKGYYSSELALVTLIKNNITGRTRFRNRFKTIECSIMDLADDIAYSTYDLEDTLKAGFMNPFDLLSIEEESAFLICKKINEKQKRFRFRVSDVHETLYNFFGEIFQGSIEAVRQNIQRQVRDDPTRDHVVDFSDPNIFIAATSAAYRSCKNIANNGYIRTQFTSDMIKKFINGIQFEVDRRMPCLSHIAFDRETFKQVEILKQFVFQFLINSPKLRVTDIRAHNIITTIFNVLTSDKGYEILPSDYKQLYMNSRGNYKKRIIADFISGMTDRYAIEFYCRLTSETPQTIYKPV